jgi:g-D-glutamyl-meso-diaminopimelate peptidase
MAMLDYWTDRDIAEFGDVCFHIVPMVNPDGVALVQSGVMTDAVRAIYERDLAMGYTDLPPEEYLRQWKANGLGVDLNKTFDAGWHLYQGRPHPSSEQYKGTQLCDAAESRALRDYTLAYDFDVTVSYHAMGSLIFREYGERVDVNAASLALGEAVGATAGYAAVGSYAVDGAGYKDWAMDKLGIPSLTIEVGSEESPQPLRELEVILARNLQVFPRIIQWLQAQPDRDGYCLDENSGV